MGNAEQHPCNVCGDVESIYVGPNPTVALCEYHLLEWCDVDLLHKLLTDALLSYQANEIRRGR